MPWAASLLLGGGSLVIGAVSPLYDSYVPPLLQRHLSSSAWIGAAMGIDNVLALLLVPIIGALSDATHTRLGRRVPSFLPPSRSPWWRSRRFRMPIGSGWQHCSPR